MSRPKYPSKVLHLLPADGWRAVYSGSDGAPNLDRLVCWALVDSPDQQNEDRDFGEVIPWSQQALVGLVADSDGDVTLACLSANFICYASPDDPAAAFAEQSSAKDAELRKKGWRS